MTKKSNLRFRQFDENIKYFLPKYQNLNRVDEIVKFEEIIKIDEKVNFRQNIKFDEHVNLNGMEKVKVKMILVVV